MANCRIKLKSGGFLLQSGGTDQAGPWLTYKALTGCHYFLDSFYSNLWQPLWQPVAKKLTQTPYLRARKKEN